MFNRPIDPEHQPYSRQTVAKTSRLRGATVTPSVCPYCAVGCGQLIYAKGGVAFADQDYNWIVTKGSKDLATAKFSDTHTGWMVGGGAEWALWHNWSAKLEYNYMDFGTETINVAASVCLSGNCSKKDVRVDIEERMHVVKLGINYRFGMPGW